MEHLAAIRARRKAKDAQPQATPQVEPQVEALISQIKALRTTDDLAAVNAGLVVSLLLGKVKPDAARAAVSALLAQRHFIVDKAREKAILRLIEKHEQQTRRRLV